MTKTREVGVKQGVILAAGHGSRIFPLSVDYPKPLLPVLNKPVIQYQIEVMRDAGIVDIIIVIGILGSKIKTYFKNGSSFGVRISYVVDNNPQGIASSLMKAKAKISGPFALFLGDIFVVRADIKSAVDLFVRRGAEGVIIGKREIDPEAVSHNFSVIIGDHGQVIKVIEKPKKPPSLFKGYGLYLFSAAIFEAISRTPRSTLRNEYEITDSIQTLIDIGGKVYSQEWDNWDFNLSYPRDLLDCNLKMLKENKIDFLIGRDVQIGKNTRIVSSIVGDRAVLDNVWIEECLVFPEVEVSVVNTLVKRHILDKGLSIAV